MKKRIKIILILITTSIYSYGDVLGAEIGYSVWNSRTIGDIKNNADTLDFNNDLGLGSNNNEFFWVLVEHPVPLIPNVKIQKINFISDGNGKTTKNITFGKKMLALSPNTKNEFMLNQKDVILYWEILDNWVNLDIGFNAKSIDGSIKMINNENEVYIDENFNAIMPMLYSKLKFDLPFTGISIEADASYMKYSKNSFSDTNIAINYNIYLGLGLKLGAKEEKLVFDNLSDISANIKLNGLYTGIYYHF